MAGGIPARLTRAELRKFALTVGAAFLVLAAVAWWRGHLPIASTLGLVGGLLSLAGMVVPSRLGPVHRGWMGFSLAISKVTAPVFMGIVFFLVIWPTGALIRAFGRNPLSRTRVADSYWAPRAGAQGPRSDLNRQF